MTTQLPTIPVTALTSASLDGQGVFDVLMRAMKAHLLEEYGKSRIRGPEYATVYLGSLESTLRAALEFLVQGNKLALEAQLLEQQIALALVEVQKAEAELEILQQQALKIPHEIAHLQAQTALAEQQVLNQQAEERLTDAKRDLTSQQTANAMVEGTVLVAQECKLRAEYDVLMLQKQKVTAETALLNQKVATEKAQVLAVGVDPDSVIGRQKGLYQAQTNGFTRDAEQKAADLLIKTWSVRRSTDEGTVASDVAVNGSAPNYLGDGTIGRVVTKLLAGVGA